MLAKIEAWFKLAMYENEEDRRVARVLLGLILVFLLGSFSILGMGWIWGDHTYTLILIIGCGFQILLLALLFRGNLSIASYAMVFIYIFCITSSATVGQGLRDYVIMAYPAVIVFAGLAEKQRGLIVSTLLTFIGLAWLIQGEISGWQHPNLPVTWFDLLITTIIIMAIALEVNMLVGNLKDRLTQLRHELAERQNAEKALNQSREMYRLLAENISDVIWIFDVNENRTRYISPSVKQLRGSTPEEVIGNDMSAALTPTSLQEVQKKIQARVKAFYSGERETYVDELEQLRKDGSTIWTEVHTSFHINHDNGHLEMYGVSHNIAERKRNEELLQEANKQMRKHVTEVEQLQIELREQLIRDPMTGLYNRRYMQDVFNREFARASREGYMLSVIMLDLDELKYINDTYGHHIGDAAIQCLAACLKTTTRAEDITCRYGGDEFTIVMGKTSIEDAFKRVEEWRKYLDAHPLEIDSIHQVQVKFTAGIASFPVHGSSVEEIINYADIALYRAKARGRNCTIIFE